MLTDFKSYYLLWIAAAIILIIGAVYTMIPGFNSDFAVNMFDRYFVIGNLHLSLFLSFVCFILGAGYHYFNQSNFKLNPKLKRLHIAGTIACALVCWIAAFTLNRKGNFGNRGLEQIFAFFLILLFIVQISYFLNLFKTISKTKNLKH